MSAERHAIMDGKVHVYRRKNTPYWQCSIYLAGRNQRATTHERRLEYALGVAREWALDLIARHRSGDPLAPRPQREPGSARPARRSGGAKAKRSRSREKTFREAAEVFVTEYVALTRGERNESYVESKSRTLRLHLLPFFGAMRLSEVTPALIQDYRLHRLNPPPADPQARRWVCGQLRRVRPATRPARNTLHSEIVVLRQVLKTAIRKGWLTALPDMSAPYRANGKIVHRGWFSPEEYKRLVEAARVRARQPRFERHRAQCEKFLDYVIFMGNTGLRPDEASRLQYRDVSIVHDEATDERILEIEVRGKRGVGYCKSMPAAVAPFIRMRKRSKGRPTDVIFGAVQRELLNAVLQELDLKQDRDGNQRTAYSLRHTYICMRLMEGADIYQVAKNCRTSVDMIEKYYAAHIKTRLDAAAINVRRTPKPRKTPSA